MSDGAGRGSPTPYAYFDPDSSSWRTSQLLLAINLPSEQSSPTYTRSGSMRSGLLFERMPWAPHTEGPDCSYWPTPTSQNMAGGVGYQMSRQAGGTTTRWPTLTGAVRMSEGRPMQEPGLLNPAWVEWLMGLPLGWTDIGFTPSETP